MSTPKVYKHVERGLAVAGISPEEAARTVFLVCAEHAKTIEFSKDHKAIIIDGKIVVRPSKSSGLAVDIKG